MVWSILTYTLKWVCSSLYLGFSGSLETSVWFPYQNKNFTLRILKVYVSDNTCYHCMNISCHMNTSKGYKKTILDNHKYLGFSSNLKFTHCHSWSKSLYSLRSWASNETVYHASTALFMPMHADSWEIAAVHSICLLTIVGYPFH